MKLNIGSRKSTLAMWQSNCIADLLRAAHPDLEVEIITMDTLGDRRQDVPMPSIGAKGLFTQELEDALLADQIDLAVHSLKDLPSTLPEGLCYAGSPKRGVATDAFISTRWKSFEELPQGATIATGSQRRRAQLLHRRPDLKLTDLRGNIGTRLEKLEKHGYDGIIMATVALHRLKMTDRITTELAPEQFIPAVSQGAMGVETRIGRDDVTDLLDPVFDDLTVTAVTAERAFMRLLDGGCSVSLGAYCVPVGKAWNFHGWVSSTDGTQVLTEMQHGTDPHQMAIDMANDFINRGAQEILHS